MLQGQPHPLNVVASVSPITLGADVAKHQLLLQSQPNRCRRATDFTRNKVFAAPGRLMIEKNAIAREEVVMLSIDPDKLGGEGFGAPVWIDRGDSCFLSLWHLSRRSEDLA